MPRERVILADDVEQLLIEYVDVEEIGRWPGNPKEHDIGAIAASILRFGMRDPIAVNRRNHQIEEGHGRDETLRALRAQGRPAPRYVRVTNDGRWFAPVLWFDDDEITQHGYALAHNRTQDLGGGYDNARLLEALREAATHNALDATGFDSDDYSALRRKLKELDNGPGDQTGQIVSHFQLIVTCETETDQIALIEELSSRGLTVRALVS